MSEVPNLDRGEVAITLDGKVYPMRPSYEAQVAIERELGVSMDELLMRARRLAAGEANGAGFKLLEMAVIIREGVKAAGKSRNDPLTQRWTVDRIGELIVADRFSFNQPITEFVLNAVMGGADPKKEPAANEPAA